MGCNFPGCCVHGNSPGKNIGSGWPFPSCHVVTWKAKQLWDQGLCWKSESWGPELRPDWSQCLVCVNWATAWVCWAGDEPSFESAPKQLWGIGQWGLEGLLYFPVYCVRKGQFYHVISLKRLFSLKPKLKYNWDIGLRNHACSHNSFLSKILPFLPNCGNYSEESGLKKYFLKQG